MHKHAHTQYSEISPGFFLYTRTYIYTCTCKCTELRLYKYSVYMYCTHACFQTTSRSKCVICYNIRTTGSQVKWIVWRLPLSCLFPSPMYVRLGQTSGAAGTDCMDREESMVIPTVYTCMYMYKTCTYMCMTPSHVIPIL